MILLKNRDRNPSFKKGEYVEINDAGNYPMELSVDGVCEQVTTTGKNNIDKDNYILDTWDNNYDAFQVSLKAGTYTLSSNTTMETIKASNHIGTDWGSVPFGTSEKTKEYTFTISEDYNGGVVIKLDGGLQINHTNIANYDIQLENGSIATDFEPYTGGQPSPSPDYPQEIKTITGNIKVTSCGKNLFDGEIELGNITPTDGKLVDSNSRTRSKNFTKVKPNTTYSFTRTTGQYRWVIGYTKDKIGITDGNFKEQASALYQVYADKFTFQFTTSPTTEYIKWYDTNSVNLNEKVQIERGSIVTEYEPYQSSSLNITIPENEFIGKLNDTYKDTLNVVYKDDGHYHLMLNKMIGKVVLDGSENWTNYTSGDNIVFYIEKNDTAYGSTSNNPIISSHFISKYEATNGKIFLSGNVHRINICSSEFATLGIFKTWLSTHNVEVYYALATPYELDLGIVDTLLSYDKITNIFTDSDLYPVINVKYYKDFEFDKILRSGYNIDEQEYEIAKKQMANGKRKRILSSYDDCIIKINLGLLDNKTYQEYKEQLDDGEFHYWSYKYNQYKKANFILTKPSITTEYAYDDDIGINDMEITLEKSSDIE